MAMLTALSLLPDSCGCMRLPATPKRTTGITRRAVGSGLFVAALTSSQSCSAFENGVPEMSMFKDEKKSGVDIPLYTPNNKRQLGLQDGKLATCDNASPNCFSTSGDLQRLLERWSPQAGGDAMGELVAAVKAYPPGQNGACLSPGGSSSCIDGGGFKIMPESTPSYLYIQFESLKYVCRTPSHEPCPLTNVARVADVPLSRGNGAHCPCAVPNPTAHSAVVAGLHR